MPLVGYGRKSLLQMADTGASPFLAYYCCLVNRKNANGRKHEALQRNATTKCYNEMLPLSASKERYL